MSKLYKKLRYKSIDWTLRLKDALGFKSTFTHLETGERMRIRNCDALGRSVIQGQFERTLANILPNYIRAGMTVLDVGANIGYYTLQMANLATESGCVIAFEPNPEMCSELRFNIDLNHFKHVQVFPVALSDSSGESKFHLPIEGREAHGSLKTNLTFQSVSSITVTTRKLDDVLEELGVSKVDFIKIDVEGAEGLVVRGATRLLSGGTKPYILFECAEHLCAGFGYRVFDILQEIVAFGYTVEQIDYGNWLACPKLINQISLR